MNARERLEAMARTDRGDMTVWDPDSVRDAIDAHRVANLTDGINALLEWTDRPNLDPGLHFAIGVLTSLRDDLDTPTP